MKGWLSGFKNVSLGNVISSSYGGTMNNTFVNETDNQLLKKHKGPSFEVNILIVNSRDDYPEFFSTDPDPAQLKKNSGSDLKSK